MLRNTPERISLEVAVHVGRVSHAWPLLVMGKPATRPMKSRTAHTFQPCGAYLCILTRVFIRSHEISFLVINFHEGDFGGDENPE